jgi:tRNA(Ile)-lysidine synthase
MIRKIRQFVEKHTLLTPNATVVAGLSGGADSVVLLYALQRLGYRCLAAHCNFHLRGAEALEDEQFAETFAQSLQIPFYKADFETRAVAHERGISIEMAARELRYEWFERLRCEQHAEAIAVAHHRDDSLETLLLNLIRGTGIRGLTGIPPKNGAVVRPLLGVSKQEILNFAETKGLAYRTDSSNLQDEFLRNKIRLSLMPLLHTMNPSVDEALLRTMEDLGEAEKIYTYYIKESIPQVFYNDRIDIPRLRQQPSPEALLFEILRNYGFGRDTVRDACRATDGLSGKVFYSPTHRLVKDREVFILQDITKTNTKDFPPEITEAEVTIVPVDENFVIPKDRRTACFDADKLQFPLQIRGWRRGDKFVPFGMKHFQKVSDYFNNHKFSLPEKESARLLCSGEDSIWIIGHRTDNRSRIDETTRRACRISLLWENPLIQR